MDEAARPVAAFDFDGTLAKGDSLVPFLLRLIGGRRVAQSILRHGPALALVQAGRADRDITKERFIAHALAGHSAQEATSIGEAFAADIIDNRLFPEMVARLQWHQGQGHETVLVSASIDTYLVPLARELHFDEALTTRLEIRDGVVTGKLVGVNVRAAEKARLLEGHLGGDHHRELWAYGNSSGDYELLEMADHPFWVDKSGHFAPWSGR